MRAISSLPALAVSSLHPLCLDLHEGRNAWIVCPEAQCGRWVEVHRGLVQVHRRDGVRCPGGRRRVAFDLSPAQHEANRAAARHAARTETLRTAVAELESGWTALSRVPVPAAVHQIAARRALLPA